MAIQWEAATNKEKSDFLIKNFDTIDADNPTDQQWLAYNLESIKEMVVLAGKVKDNK